MSVQTNRTDNCGHPAEGYEETIERLEWIAAAENGSNEMFLAQALLQVIHRLNDHEDRLPYGSESE